MRHKTWDELFELAAGGNERALARFISRVENREPGWREAMQALYPRAGNALIIGITGPPGAGKSSLCNRIANNLLQQDYRVAIIAVDPSSPFSGGALLGDRLRMRDVDTDTGVFIRSMATRGSLGGLCQAARDVTRTLDAAGYDIILVETVGVGQDEIDVVRTADVVAVVCVPGQGDGIQAIKAGIMEIADLFIVNKADCDGADMVVTDIRAMQALGASHDAPPAPVIATSATTGLGIEETVDALASAGDQLRRDSQRRKAQVRQEVMGLLEAEVAARLRQRMAGEELLTGMVESILQHESDPYAAAYTLLEDFLASAYNADPGTMNTEDAQR